MPKPKYKTEEAWKSAIYKEALKWYGVVIQIDPHLPVSKEDHEKHKYVMEDLYYLIKDYTEWKSQQ